MDEFFDKVKFQAFKAKDEAARITKQMMGKTNNIITQTKLSFAVSETEGKIKEIYESMGKTLYENYLEDGSASAQMKESCEKLDALMSELYDLKEKISEVKDSVRCECGEYNQKTAAYCSKCGSKLKAEYSDTVDADYQEAEENVVIIKPKKPEDDGE